jgi:hypothetical protein
LHHFIPMINDACVEHSFIFFFCLFDLRFWRFCYFLLCLLFRWLWFCLTNLQSIPNHGFTETLTLVFFSFMFLDLLIPEVVLAEFMKNLLSFSIQVSSSACDNLFFWDYSQNSLSQYTHQVQLVISFSDWDYSQNSLSLDFQEKEHFILFFPQLYCFRQLYCLTMTSYFDIA